MIEIILVAYFAGFIAMYLAAYIHIDDKSLSIQDRYLLIRVSAIWPLMLLGAALETWVDIFSVKE